MSDEITLHADEGEFRGWKEIAVTRSTQSLAAKFDLSMTDTAPDDPAARRIRRGDACEIRIGDDVLVAGYVHKVVRSYTGERNAVQVSGADATADLVRCSIMSSPALPASLERLVAQLCEPFQIGVLAEVDTGPVFTAFRIEPGETVFAAIDRACRYRGVVPRSDAQGNVVLTLPASGSPVATLNAGEHILAASVNDDEGDRFSVVRYEAQPTQGWAGVLGGAPLSVTVTDDSLRRYLPFAGTIEDPPSTTAALRARAQRELNLRAARSHTFAYTLRGWRTGGETGELWRVDDLVTVNDPRLAVSSPLLLAAARFKYGSRARKTELQFMRPEAFDLRALEPPSGDPRAEFWQGAP